MKLSLIFSCFLLLVACSTTKQLNNLNAVTKINGNKVFFEDGSKGNLAIKKGSTATVIYLVRHAEKAKEGGRDPLLTKEGTQRALRLSNILKAAELHQVYSTEYQRTQLTAAPTAAALGKKVEAYNPRDLKGFAQQVKKEKKGDRLLIVGHSNTTPTLVNALVGKEQFPMIDESEYGDLFVVTVSETGDATAVLLKY